MTLLCFQVEGNNDPEDTMVVFAKTSIEAKRRWANEHGDGDRYIAGISAKRCKGWDQFAPGPVPCLEMIDDGWFWECSGCNRTISQETIDYGFEDHDGNVSEPLRPYEPKAGAIWCSKECHDADKLDKKRRATLKRRAIAVVERAVTRAFPGVTLSNKEYSKHAYIIRRDGRLCIHDVRVQFETPGMKHGGGLYVASDEAWRQGFVEEQGPIELWQSSRPKRLPLTTSERKRDVKVTMAKGDIEVWEAWRAKCKSKEAAE